MDTYRSGDVPVPEGDKAKILTQEELGQGQEDHCWFNHGSPYTTSVFPKDTERDVWFLDQAIWRRRILTHKKRRIRWEQLKIKKIPWVMRNMKNSILEEPLIHLIIWITNDDFMNEEDDEAEWSRRSLPTKQTKDKYSIVI